MTANWKARYSDGAVILTNTDGASATINHDKAGRVTRVTLSGENLTGSHLRSIPLARVVTEQTRTRELVAPDGSLAGQAASIYNQMLKESPDAKAKDLAQVMNKPISTVQRWLAKARELGMVQRTPTGRPSGNPDDASESSHQQSRTGRERRTQEEGQ